MAPEPIPPSPKSPDRKKARLAKPRKTYLFQPTNTLAYNPRANNGRHKSAQTEAGKHEHKPGNRGYVSAARSSDHVTDLETPNAVTDTHSTRPDASALSGPQQPCASNTVRFFDRSTDQQSSDDSFDGVRWRPAKSPAQKFARPILSSPLKNTENQQQNHTNTAFLANEMTDSMLHKYGMTMPQKLSQTPLYGRTKSDIVAFSGDSSPTLQRSKSFDPRCLPPEKENPSENASRLNTWIDKFEVKNVEKTEEIPAASSPLKRSAHNDDDAFSSDDDAFLANLKCDSLPQLSQIPPQSVDDRKGDDPSNCTAHKADYIIQETVQKVAKKPEFDESDPFSDDLDLVAIESVLTQPSTASSSFSNVKPGNPSASLDKQNSEKRPVTPPHRREDSYGAKISYSRPDFSRYQVTSVMVSSYQVQTFKKKQLILTAVDQHEKVVRLMVRGEAADLDIKADDVVHVVHTSPENPRLVSDTHNLLIWNPDTLVASTTVADQLDCPRKTVLTKRLSFPGSYSIPLLAGTIVHEIFQLCFVTGKSKAEFMREAVEIEIQRRLLDIYTLGDVVDELRDKIYTHLPYIEKWFQSFVRKPPVEIPTNKRQQKIRFSVAETLDIEERVWSPMFGIKGIADVTLKANLSSDNSVGQFLLPMEIKTGQDYISHQAQAALYSLLFKDRYNVDISSFLLVYTSNDGSTTKHDISVPDLKSLVNLRNRISVFLQPGNQELPDLMRQQKCDRCFVQESCMTYNYLTEDGTAANSGLKDGVFEDLTAHLGKEKYKHFLASWDYLLSKEEQFVARFDKDLWVLTAKEREQGSGKSLGDLVITECKPKTNEYIYTFRRKSPNCPFSVSQISKNDRVIVSDECGHFALASGYVRHIDTERITISSRRRIISTESKTDKFHRAGVLRASQNVPQEADAVVFRVDKDEISYGMGVARFNILNLFLSSGDHRRRKLVVDLQEPTFSASPQFAIEAGHFNECQMRAFEKVSRTNDYSLILGMPGTGKTTVIAHLIKMLVASKKTVLLTSYTNSAVDNILLKVAEYGIDFLRIGIASRVHPSVRDHVPGSEKNKVESYGDFQSVYSKPYVVAATCLGVQDPAFTIRDHFDYCIIDEASQVSMPVSLGPLSLCDKFVMVGDHYQLPPLVSHPDLVVKAGLSQSLFQILATAHPQSVVELKYQYRMCEEIMLISNRLVYKNRLICGNVAVAKQVLKIPHKGQISQSFLAQPRNIPWLEPALQEQNKVLFYDHDLLPGYERVVGENTTNPTEVELVRQTVEALCRSGVDPSKIGIMTLYRSQLKLLMDTFRHIPELEILTADRFQGRDKHCIVISMVRSNKDRRSGDLLKDWRRINVAVTRARAKLIVFGSVSTLSNAESVSDFVALAKREGWVHELSESALTSYYFEKPISPQKVKVGSKIGEKVIGRHPLVRSILADMGAQV